MIIGANGCGPAKKDDDEGTIAGASGATSVGASGVASGPLRSREDEASEPLASSPTSRSGRPAGRAISAGRSAEPDTPSLVCPSRRSSCAGGNGKDVGYALALDSTGKIVVTGGSNDWDNYDMVIWRYIFTGVLDEGIRGPRCPSGQAPYRIEDK
jgi:hypothetical protein